MINPGAYTHTSYAIRDAISSITLPTIEVHLSDIKKREPFRQFSAIEPVCIAQISGHGWQSYTLALEALLQPPAPKKLKVKSPMPGNSIGQLFRITTFGESHGEMIGVVIDGCPAGLGYDLEFIQSELDRRKPGQSKITTQRKESDTVKIVSGVFEGRSTGAPITALILNEDQRSKDYTHIAQSFRPSHADFTYEKKYGHRDYRGGGRSSARETAARVAGGAIPPSCYSNPKESPCTPTSPKLGSIAVTRPPQKLDLTQVEATIVRCPDTQVAKNDRAH